MLSQLVCSNSAFGDSRHYQRKHMSQSEIIVASEGLKDFEILLLLLA